MNRGLVLAIVLGLCAGIGLTLLAQSTRDEVMRAEASWDQASRNGDKVAYASLLADEFSWTFIDGRVINKNQRINSLPESGFDVAYRDVRIHEYGNAAVVVGTGELTIRGRPIRERFVRVWINRDDRWQLALFQATEIVQ